MNVLLLEKKHFILLIFLLLSSFLFVYLLLFSESDQIATRKIFIGNILQSTSPNAKGSFQNCIVSLNQNQTVIASCRKLYALKEQVKVVKTTTASNKVSYFVCEKEWISCK